VNILLLDWNSFCNDDVFEALQELGHNVIKLPFKGYKSTDEEVERLLTDNCKRSNCDFVFSFNYFPKVSKFCQKLAVKYVSWVYDSPHIHVYSYTVLNTCNYIFLFDYAMYAELKDAGIKTVYYMPLAINERRMNRLQNTQAKQSKYHSDISFVGSLYTEPKHRIYNRFQNIDPYARGYLDGLLQAQLHVQGYNFLQEMLTPEIVAEMQEAYPTDPNADTVLSPEAIYADYVLARQVTSMERKDILTSLGKVFRVDLYTHDKELHIPGVNNKGEVDYYDEMPYVFRNSKINLNISLRSIKTGIPLRAFDIMGSGGFLLSNYQQELFEYFIPDEDFVYYSDSQDLLEKVEYYLIHDKERIQIAKNGCEKVRNQHSFKQRVNVILDIVQNGIVDESCRSNDDVMHETNIESPIRLDILFVRSTDIEMLGLADGFVRLGHNVKIADTKVDLHMTEINDVIALRQEAAKENVDLVVTYDFCPGVSKVCNEKGIPYLAWVFDSPLAELYLREVRNTCNYICVFDRRQYERLMAEKRIPHLLYVPLSSEVEVFSGVTIYEGDELKYGGDVAFVGRLYNNESWSAVLEGAKPEIKEEVERLLSEGLCKWDGEESLFGRASDELIEVLASKLSAGVLDIYEWDKRYLCESLKLARRKNEVERVELLEKLSEKYQVVLYSDGNIPEEMGAVEKRPWVDYWKEMPKVFKLSKINLNITSRSIESGIPQRVWDIMAAGGFCLTNYQTEIEEYFEIGKDIEVYHDLDELERKVDYYLTHEEERKRIAQSGYEKVCAEHNYSKRLQGVLESVFGEIIR